MAGGMALQWLLGPLSDRIGRRPVLLTGALIFTLACFATLFTTSMEQFLAARFVQGTSICFIATVGYVTVQEAFGQTKAIKLMAIITSIVLIAPIIGPLSGAALMHFVHWKALFGIIAVMGFIARLAFKLEASGEEYRQCYGGGHRPRDSAAGPTPRRRSRTVVVVGRWRGRSGRNRPPTRSGRGSAGLARDP